MRAALARIMSFESFQRPSKIAGALRKIGVTDFWNGVAAKLSRPAEELKKKLNNIVKRRNQIAHEGDVSQSKKARNKPRRIGPQFTRDSLEFVRDLVYASEEYINEELANQ